MIRFLFYLLLGYIIWRILQTVFRMVNRSSQWGERPHEPPSQQQPPPANEFRDVKDARFEDLPPSKPKDDNTSPSN